MRKIFVALFIVILSQSATPPAYAKDDASGLDANSMTALAETVTLLTDPAKRGKQPIDEHIKKLTGGSPEKMERIYALSARVFQRLLIQSGGDLNQIIAKFQHPGQDPMVTAKAFAKDMTPDEKKELRAISLSVAPPTKPAASAK